MKVCLNYADWQGTRASEFWAAYWLPVSPGLQVATMLPPAEAKLKGCTAVLTGPDTSQEQIDEFERLEKEYRDRGWDKKELLKNEK